MKHFFLIFLSVLYAFAALASADNFHSQVKKFCDLKNELACYPNEVLDNLRVTQVNTVLACQNFYRQNHCEDVKHAVGVNRQSMILSCDPKELCKGFAELNEQKCIIDGVSEHASFFSLAMFLGSQIGGGLGMAISSVTAPMLLYSVSASEEQCDRDVNYKKMAVTMHNLLLKETERPLDVNGKDKAILSMQCLDLRAFLQTRLNTLSQNRTTEEMWSLQKGKAGLPRSQTELLKLLRSQNCYNPTVIKENLCKGITQLVLAGVGITSVATRVAASLPRPRLLPTINMKKKYKGESTRSQNRVKYFSYQERKKFLVTIGPDGLLYRNGRTFSAKPTMYVMDKDGNFYVYPSVLYKENFTFHSSFFEGEPVAAAGIMTVIKGKITYIDRSSGHYRPSKKHLRKAVDRLKSNGADMSGVRVEFVPQH
jgi:hypothetical protein